MSEICVDASNGNLNVSIVNPVNGIKKYFFKRSRVFVENR